MKPMGLGVALGICDTRISERFVGEREVNVVRAHNSDVMDLLLVGYPIRVSKESHLNLRRGDDASNSFRNKILAMRRVEQG